MRKAADHRVVSGLKDRRGNVVEAVVMGVGVALSINLLAVAIAPTVSAAIIGSLAVVVALACIGYVVYRRLAGRTLATSIDALVLVTDDQSTVIDTEGYEFGEEVSRIARAVFRENPALSRQWRDDPPSKAFDFETESKGVRRRETAALKLLREFSEFYVLHRLAMHLSAYFSDFKPNEVITLERNDLPDVLLRNRVLELLSRDTRDRPDFDGMEIPPGTVSVYGQDLIYRKFSLTLPRGSTVERRGGALVVRNSGIRIDLTVVADGLNANVPVSYVVHVLGREYRSVQAYRVRIVASAQTTWRLLFSRRGYRYHEWIESFLADLTEKADFNCSMERLRWPTIEMLLYCARKMSPEVSRSKPAE